MPNRITVGPQPDAQRVRYGCLMGRELALQAPFFPSDKIFLPKKHIFMRSSDFGIEIAELFRVKFF